MACLSSALGMQDESETAADIQFLKGCFSFLLFFLSSNFTLFREKVSRLALAAELPQTGKYNKSL